MEQPMEHTERKRRTINDIGDIRSKIKREATPNLLDIITSNIYNKETIDTIVDLLIKEVIELRYALNDETLLLISYREKSEKNIENLEKKITKNAELSNKVIRAHEGELAKLKEQLRKALQVKHSPKDIEDESDKEDESSEEKPKKKTGVRKLTCSEIRRLRKSAKTKTKSQLELSKEFNISRSAVNRIVKKITYKNC